MSSEYGDPTRMPTRLFKGIRGQTALGNSRPGPRLLPHTPGMTLPPILCGTCPLLRELQVWGRTSVSQ